MHKTSSHTTITGAKPFFIKKSQVGCLLCHGFTGTPNEMRGIGNYLADNNITVYGPLLPGHGTTIEEMKTTTTEDYYQEYSKAYQKLREICEEIFICGLSLGGVLTLKFASENKVQGLVTISTPVAFRQPESFFLPIFGPLLKKIALKKKKLEIAEQKKYNIICYDKYPIGPALSLRNTILETKKVLKKITAPILIIQGLLDEKWIVKSANKIFNDVSSKEKDLVFLEKSSHCTTAGPEKDKIPPLILLFIQKHSKTSIK